MALTITDLNNAKLDVDHIDALATSTDLTATDRLGRTKDTLEGKLKKFDDALGDISALRASLQTLFALTYLSGN